MIDDKVNVKVELPDGLDCLLQGPASIQCLHDDVPGCDGLVVVVLECEDQFPLVFCVGVL